MFLRSLTTILLSMCMLASAAADTLTFEDRPVDLTVLDAYQGFQWNTSGVAYTVDWNYGFTGTGAQYGAVSGSKVLVGVDSVSIKLAAPGTFDLSGAWFTAAFGYVPQSLSFVGMLSGQSLYAAGAQSLSATAASFINLGWTGIDELVIVNDVPGWAWVMDDLSYTMVVSAVPEPATWLLLLAGLGVAVWRSRAARRAAPSPAV